MANPESFNRVVAVGVDMQNDFFPGGALGVEGGDEVIEPFNQASRWVRDQNGLVVFTRDWHPEETKHFAEYGGPWPPHCIENTHGADFKKGLDIRNGDTVLSKGTDPEDNGYSGFDGIARDGLTLETILRPMKGERVAALIGGLATDYCVQATVLDALEFARKQEKPQVLGIFVLQDAIRAVNVEPTDGEKSIADMEAKGASLVTTNELTNNQILTVRN